MGGEKTNGKEAVEWLMQLNRCCGGGRFRHIAVPLFSVSKSSPADRRDGLPILGPRAEVTTRQIKHFQEISSASVDKRPSNGRPVTLSAGSDALCVVEAFVRTSAER